MAHIFAHHGDAQTELQRGNLPLQENIIENLPEIIKSPDEILPGEVNKEGKRGVVLKKNLPDGTAVYIQFDNTGRKTLQGKTLYIKKKNSMK